MYRYLFAVLLLLAPGCASSAAVSPAPVNRTPQVAPEDLRLNRIPARAGEYRLQGVQRISPELGMVLRYSTQGPVRLDVFIYPAPDSVREAADPVAAAAETGRTELRAGLELEAEKGNLTAFEVVSDSSIALRLPHAGVTGAHTTLRISHGDQTRDSFQHHFLIGDQLVKVRSTLEPGTADPATIDHFVREFLEQITTPQSVPDRTRGA